MENSDIRKNFKLINYIFIFLIVVLVIASVINYIYIPATLIMSSLELFFLCYCIKDDKKQKKTITILFTLGVILVIISVIYTIMHIV